MRILGLDIGGANLKASLIEDEHIIKNYLKYYPIWTHDIKELDIMLFDIRKTMEKTKKLDAIAITMTAELSDAFYTKREGVLLITDSIRRVFHDYINKLYFMNIFGQFVNIEEVLKNPLQIAAANWAATSRYIGTLFKNCILIDIGSTTTDIIPIINHVPLTYGKNDTNRLLSGELVYTGVLRTEIPSITHNVPYRNQLCPIASEKFALIADIHLILGHIKEEDYIIETADGRDKNIKDSMARIARIICADIEMLSESEIMEIVKYIYQKQLEQIENGIRKVIQNLKIDSLDDFKIIVTGLGAKFLAKPAAENVGFTSIINLDNYLGNKAGITAPSAAIALLLEQELKESI